MDAHAAYLDSDSVLVYKQYLCSAQVTDSAKSQVLLISPLKLSPQSNPPKQLQEVISTHIQPSLEALRRAAKEASPFALTSIAWVSFFTGCLLLYIPDRTFDPALKPIIDRDRFLKHKTGLETKLKALRLYEEAFTNSSTNLRCELVEKELQALGTQPQVPRVVRPAISELPQLQGEFANLLSSVVQRSPGPQSICSIVESDKAAMQDLRLLRRNIERAVQRLSDNFRSYDDITKPIVGLLEGLDVGLALAAAASAPNVETKNQVEAIFMCTPFLGLQLGYLGFTVFTEIMAAKGSRLRTSVLKIAAIERGITGCIPYSLMSSVVEIFQSYYDDWKKQLVDGQREHLAKASLYRYRGSRAESEISSDQEFNLLFPSHDEGLEAEPGAHNDDRQYVQILVSELAELQDQILIPHQAPADQIIQMLQHATGDIVRAWKAESNPSIFPVHPKHMLPGLIVGLSASAKNLLYSNPSHCEYNFYVDVNLTEARKLVELLTQVEQRFNLIQQHWPEHATLKEVLRTSRELLAFRHTDPLAKIITKCEQLHGHVHEWQVVASREHSATSEYDRLTELLIGWRRLELSTWARLLEMEDEKCSEDAKAWWFVAYEAIIAASVSIAKTGGDISHHSQDLVATLNEFFSQTSVGQFCEKLRLVETFKYHVDLLCKELPSLVAVRAAIINFLRYQTRFKASVIELNRKNRKTLEKDLNEVVLLASWKDTNIMALRESAKRSHHKLFKIIRKYRTLLALPLETIISQGIPQPVIILERDNVPSTDLALAVDQIALETCRTNVHSWDKKPQRYTEPHKTAFRMYKLRRQIPSAFDCSLYLDSFSTNLVESIEVLKKETPFVQTSENKHIIKHLKTRKRRVFADTLKKIKSMGFTSNPDTDILSKQATLPVVLGTSPALESDLLSDGINVAEYYFHKCLENMAIVRLTAQQHSEDLTSGEVARCLGYLESMLFILLRQRESLSASLGDHGSFKRLLAKMKSLWAPEKYTLQVQRAQKHSASFEATERCIKWLCCIVDVAVVVIKQHNGLGRIHTPMALEGLGQWTQRLGSLAMKFAQLPTLPLGLSTSVHGQTFEESQRALDQLITDIKRWKKEEPIISFALDQVLLWASPGANMDDTHTNGVYMTSVSEFDQEISNIIDTILVGMQHMQEALSATPSTSEEKAWLLRADASQVQGIKALHVKIVSGMTENALGQLLYLSSMTPNSLEIAAARCAVALPIIEQYEIIHLDAIRQHLKFHTSLGRLVCILTTCFKEIVAQGFCNPSEKSSTEDEKADKLEGGTGLGDGMGATDISKDIQDDEDLSELAQDGSKHDIEEGIEDEEDAVDMQQDELDGELGEAVEDKDVDASDAQSDDSNDVLDDQVGEVDDLDPSAVDEKLWEGSTEDAEKDQKGEQSKGKKQTEIAAQDDSRAADDDQIEEVGGEETENVSQEELQINPHLQEGDKLDLPEEMDLDDEAKPETDIDVDDKEIDKLSDIDQQDPEEANDDKTSSPNEDVEHSNIDVEDDNETNKDLSDYDMTGEATSPVDTDPDESTEGNEEGFIQDITDDAVANAENAAPSDVRGTSDSNEPQTDNRTQTENAAKGESGEKGDDAVEATAQVAMDEGQVGPGGAKTELSRSQQDSVPDKNEIEAFRKLGDALEQWHRLSQPIKQTADDIPCNVQASNDLKPRDQEFEHLPDDDVETNMQALAAATEDQAHALNSQAMELEAQDLPEDFMPDEVMTEEAVGDDRQMDEVDENLTGSEHQDKSVRAGVIVGPSTGSQDHESMDIESKVGREQDIRELDTELSSVHLAGEDLASLRPVEDARRLWSYYEGLTRELALSLTEQLRLVLAPTLATKLRGDFRTGKRLNIKRIIPYIASQYKRDKIWMRRSVPAKRNYQVMLAIDDSKSMGESGSGQLAFKTLALVSKSLSILEVGQICIVGFGDDVHVAHGFDQTFSPEAGVQVFQQFRFQQTRTNVQKLLVGSLELFRDARGKSFNAGKDLWQLELIISDGVCEDHGSIRRLVRQAQEERIVIIFVIVDSLKGKSIMDMTQATFEPDELGETKLKIRRYLDDFPFGYYLIVGDVKELPGVLAATLRQWFTEVAESV